MATPRREWVILVDEEADDRFLAQQAFKSLGSGYVLQALSTEEDLLLLLNESLHSPSLLMLGVNLPSLGGLKLLGRLRAEATYNSLPIVLLSSWDSPQVRQQARLLGATDYLLKPTSLEEMNRVVARIGQTWLGL